jgi:hypothetical protein
MVESSLASRSDNEAQLLRNVAGKQFEGIVARAINEILNREGIYAVSLKQLGDLIRHDSSFRQVLEFAKTPVHNPCDQSYRMMLPDTDVLIYYVEKDHAGFVRKRYHLATVSCKVSFHGRETQSTFWAKVLGNHGSKFYLATEDKFGELGTCEKGKKVRRLVESYMDCTYLMNQYRSPRNSLEKDIASFYNIFENSKRTGFQRQDTRIFDSRRAEGKYCKRVRPFDDLLFDLMQLRFEFRR